MIFQLILLKYLKIKFYWIITVIITLICFFIIIYMAFDSIQYNFLDMSKINEKTVDYVYVVSSNLMLIAKNYLLGILTFGIYTIFSLINNVVSLGIISNSLVHSNKIRLFYKLIPHGVFEIFGMVVSLTAVLYIILIGIRYIPKVVKRETSIKCVVENICYFLIATFILDVFIFLIAGIVEVIVSVVKLN